MELSNKKCIPCDGGVIPLTKSEAEEFLAQIQDWKLIKENNWIYKKFKFKNFKKALEFVNKVGDIAESEGHHPDIHLIDYKFVEINLSTHSISGLSENDFILAAKINGLQV